jgi:hypothetical protein
MHVREAGRAAREHVRDRQLGAVAHVFGVDPALLERPDLPVQPVLEILALGRASQQRHGGMRVHVDEPGHQHVRGSGQRLVRRESLERLRERRDGHDPAMVDRDRMILEHAARRLDRNDPAGGDQGVDVFHAQVRNQTADSAATLFGSKSKV